MMIPQPPKLVGTTEEKLAQLYHWCWELYEELLKLETEGINNGS